MERTGIEIKSYGVELKQEAETEIRGKYIILHDCNLVIMLSPHVYLNL